MATLIFDNVGFDIDAMKQMSERDFVNTHMPNDAIARGRNEQDRRKYLKSAYAIINPLGKQEEEIKDIEIKDIE